MIRDCNRYIHTGVYYSNMACIMQDIKNVSCPIYEGNSNLVSNFPSSTRRSSAN